jgi:ribosomal protein S18 acetylase RimI-like enzyme
MEPLTLAVHTPGADSVDPEELASVAAQTFPLACPPSITAEDIASFIDANLSAARFAAYLRDPQRAILTAQRDNRIIGYAMLIRSGDAELSKLYLLAEYHGVGVAAALMQRTLATAAEWNCPSVWLGVNQKNERAQRFYLKNGFTITGTRTFQVGTGRENDYVMRREFT